jgi:hypothetical protein
VQLAAQLRVGKVGGFGGFADPFDRAVGPGVAVHEAGEHFVGVEDQADQPLVVAVGVSVYKLGELAGVVQLVAVGEELAGDVVAQEAGVVGVEHPEAGVEADRVEVLAEQPGAEAVQRADAGAVEQGELAGQALGRAGRRAGAQGLADARLHLGGGGLGEGDDQELVHVAWVVGVADEVGAALGEDGGLAGAGGGGDEEAVARCRDAAKLGVGPLAHRVRGRRGAGELFVHGGHGHRSAGAGGQPGAWGRHEAPPCVSWTRTCSLPIGARLL